MAAPARLARIALIVCCALSLGIQLIRPARTNPPTDPTRTLKARMHVPDDVARVLDRACRDCHTHDTIWPWYSNVAPVSWLLIDHVSHGRRHANFSDWASYSASEAGKRIKDVCKLVRDGEMPLPSYLWMHGEARLTERDVELICAWTAAKPAN
jgi:hypothetical protein